MIWIIIFIMVVAFILMFIHFNNKIDGEATRRKQEDEVTREKQEKAQRQREREQREQKEQEINYKEITKICEHTIYIFGSMPIHLEYAMKNLDSAEHNLSHGYILPFWECIEQSTKSLGLYAEEANLINNDFSEFTKLKKRYKDILPQFPLTHNSIEKLSIGTTIANRMESLVRVAKCNYYFASIYEQRRTNDILIAGFTSLAQALDQMANKISASIYDLACSIGTLGSSLNDSMQVIHSQLGDITRSNNIYHDELMKNTMEASERERKALEILDNLQHRIKP
jgi:hypothetical protein